MDTRPRRRKTDHWLSFLRREAFVVVLVFVALGIIAVGVAVNRSAFEEHNKRDDASHLCLLDAAGTPVPNRTVDEVKRERRRLFNDCMHQEAPDVKSPLKEKHSQ